MPTLPIVAVLGFSLLSLIDDAPSGDLAKVQGRWEADLDGDEPITMTVKGDRVEFVYRNDLGSLIIMKGKLTLDESKRTWDMVDAKVVGMDESVPNYRAIYRFEGAELVVCGDVERPKGFEDEKTLWFRRPKP